MSDDIPDWVRVACGRWGRQKRRIWTGKDWHGNPDGYAQSLLGRIRDEREGAAQGIAVQRWPEVFWGDGLDVQRALTGLGERRHAALHFQYVWDPSFNVTIRQKCAYLEVKRTEYFALIERAEIWVHARLDRPDSQVVEQVQKIVQRALHNTSISATNSQTKRAGPQINLAALHRPILKRPA